MDMSLKSRSIVLNRTLFLRGLQDQLKFAKKRMHYIANEIYSIIKFVIDKSNPALTKVQEFISKIENLIQKIRKNTINDKELIDIIDILQPLKAIEKREMSDVHKFLTQDFVAKANMLEEYEKFLHSHTQAQLSLCLTKDNRYVFSGSSDHTIRMWNLETSELVKTFTGHHDRVYGLALSNDEQFLVSGSNDKSIRVWDLKHDYTLHGILKCKVNGHFKGILSIAISSDNKYIVSGSYDTKIKIWFLNSMSLKSKIKISHSNTIWRIIFLKDNTTFVSCSYDGTISINNVDGKDIAYYKIYLKSNEIDIEDCKAKITSMVMTAEEDLIYIGDNKGNVVKWNIRIEKYVDETVAHSGHTIRSITLSADNTMLLTGGTDFIIKIFRSDNLIELHKVEIHKRTIFGIELMSDNDRIVSCSSDGTIKVYSLASKCEIKLCKTNVNTSSITISNGRNFIFFGSFFNVVRYNMLDHEEDILYKHEDMVNCVIISNDDKLIISGGLDMMIKIYNMENCEIKILKTSSDYGGVYSLAISDDNLLVFSGTKSGVVDIWELLSENRIILEDKHKATVYLIAVSKSFFVSGSDDHQIFLWSQVSKKAIDFNYDHMVEIVSLKIISNEKFVLSLDLTGRIIVWNLSENKKDDVVDGSDFLEVLAKYDPREPNDIASLLIESNKRLVIRKVENYLDRYRLY